MATTSKRPVLPMPDDLSSLPADGGPDWNRLVFEKSPYLLQHAANPVDWRPWGDDAFELARELDKPVFLSIGYATCHWCHVMEHESFEDEGVAALLNEAFVCVKVDREERPDVDHVYMTVTQAFTGSGGWPMTVLLTPDRQPFFAGTYFPKEGRFGRPGIVDLIRAYADAWSSDREKLLSSADRATSAIADLTRGEPGGGLDGSALDAARDQLAVRFDPVHGGFGSAPKFSTPHVLSFLLRHWRRSRNVETLSMVDRTLTAMRAGGVFDQVGFGFHRYSTDREWLVPHFEKMLYDQALMSLACLDAYQATGNRDHARTARETLEYVLRDLKSPEGAFWSAEDADSEGVEGKFYLWTREQVREVLDVPEAEAWCAALAIVEGGNFRDEASGRKTGESIPHSPVPLARVASELGLGEGVLRKRLEAARPPLFDAREERMRPLLDDKILTDWNGLAIAALSRSARVLDEPSHAEAARGAADFVLSELRDADGRLLKRWRAGEAGLPAVLDDHAYLAWGLLELHEATFDVRYLEEALGLAEAMVERFWDDENGGLFLTAADGEKLIARAKEIYDGALPAGNSVAATVFLRLGRITGDSAWDERADAIFRAFAGSVLRGPAGHCHLLQAVDFVEGPSFEVVIAGEPDAADTRALVRAARRPFAPNDVVLLRPPGEAPDITRVAPFTREQVMQDGRATAYVCRNQACDAPTHDSARLETKLQA